jgi:hypothetical protein
MCRADSVTRRQWLPASASRHLLRTLHRGPDLGGSPQLVHIGNPQPQHPRRAVRKRLVSSTVHDLVVGSGITFSDEGVHQLKGIPGEWLLYKATSESGELSRG